MVDTVCKNSVINFQDLSTVNSTAINSWQWSFGSFTSSNIQNPVQNFVSSGTYPISLIVGTVAGCTDTIVKQLEVVDVPLVQFQPTNLCSGLSISFENLSNSAATEFLWNFGTGQMADTSQTFEPDFTFPAYGTYNVTLTANPNSSCQASTNQLINVSNVQANFSTQDTVCAETIFSFTDQSTGSNSIVQWHWNFDDLTTSVSQNNFHEFDQAGSYNVQLVVFGSDGCSDTISKLVEVLALPIVNGGTDAAQCFSDSSVTLTGTAQNSTAILWTGNGGNISPNDNTNTITYTANSTEINNGSTFLVFSSAMNPFCPIVTDTVLIDFIELPEVNAIEDFSICENQNFIPIGGTAVNTDQILWVSTGSGVIGNQNLLNTTYDPSPADIMNGSVDLVLSSVNVHGCEDDSDTLTITFAPLPTSNIEFSDTVCFLSELNLISNCNTGNGYWQTIGDGYFIPSDTGANTTYQTGLIDSDLGYANLIFHSLNNSGCAPLTDSIRITILPILEIEMEAVISCVGSPSQLVDQTVFPEEIVNWTWYIGDSTYYNNSPSHQFPDTGYFDVTLVIVSENGCRDSAIVPIKVNSLPVVDFTPIEPCIYGAYFADSSFADSTTIESWLWHFGDGDSSFVQNPNHVYDSVGKYQVSLQVTSGFGCVNSVSYQVPIYPPPVSAFTFFPNPAQVSDLITFNSKAYSVNAPVVIWDWDFANGDTSDLVNPTTKYDHGGPYEVSLIVFDAVGCRDTSIQTVFITHGPKIPGAFSPNGDGVNDYLMILGAGFEEIDFTIYNNWGRVLYHTTDVNDKGWDGTYNGEPQPLGVYVYKAWVKNIYGQEIEISGDATIIR